MPISIVPAKTGPKSPPAPSSGIWRSSLQDASFRGVPFLVATTGLDAGRRNTTHEYPQRDIPYVEDLGRKTRTFTIDGFVLGDTYPAQRDAVIAAVEQAGPGKLVHPTMGEMTVSVTGFRAAEDIAREGGMARFSFTFTEDGGVVFPTVKADTQAAVADAGDQAAVISASAFQKKWNQASGLKAVIASAVADVTSVLSVFNAATSMLGLSNVISTLGAIINLPQTIAAQMGPGGLLSQIATIKSQLSFLVAMPGDLAAGIMSLIKGFQGTFGLGGGQLGSFGLAGMGSARMASGSLTEAGGSPFLAIADAMPMPNENGAPGAPGSPAAGWNPLPTGAAAGVPSAAVIAANRDALCALVRQQAIIQATTVASQATFTTADQALAVRDDLAARLDSEMLAADDYSLVAALQALRTALVTDLTARAANLPGLASWTPPTVLPALVLASRLYDDPSMADDIVARNGVPHPGFVPARALTVLADG